MPELLRERERERERERIVQNLALEDAERRVLQNLLSVILLLQIDEVVIFVFRKEICFVGFGR